METFIPPKKLVENPDFRKQRQACLADLTEAMIDAPMVRIVNSFNSLPYCFTLQSCYGHFVCKCQQDPKNLKVLPITHLIDTVTYRIAYIAFCVEKSVLGEKFLEDLKAIEAIDPENIQFCCAEWFWNRQVNSFAIQVEPDRFKHQDTAKMGYHEALVIEKTRNQCFAWLHDFLQIKLKAVGFYAR